MSLSDITVGYMGGSGEQWLIVRNERGQALLDLLGNEVRLSTPSSSGKRQGAVKGFIENTKRAAVGCRCVPCRTGFDRSLAG